MEPLLMCHQCSMKFNSIKQLSKHREKFCVGSFVSYNDKPYVLHDWSQADDKIRQLHTLKEANIQRSEASRERDRQLINLSRNSGNYSPHPKARGYTTTEDRFGSFIPIDIVKELVKNQSRTGPYVDLRHLENIYGSYIPVQVVRKLLNEPADGRGINYEVKRLDADFNQTLEDLKRSRRTLQQSSTELQEQLSSLRNHSARTDDSDLSPYFDNTPEESQRLVIDDLKNQVNALRMQINSQRQPNPVILHTSQATYTPSQPAQRQNQAAFDFKGGSLVAEISALRQHYINIRGDPSVISQLTQMLNDAENVEQQHQAKAPPRSQQPQVSSQSSRSLLAEELYAMEAENYRLQRELVKIEQNNNSGYRGDPDRERLNKLLQLEREVEQVRALPVERNIPNHQDNPLLYKRISNIPNSRYDPEEGFTCFYDFVMGLEPSAQCCKLVLSLYNSTSELGEPSVLPSVQTEQTAKGTSAMIGARQPVQRCPPSPDLGLVVELQTSSSTPDNLRTRAWLKLDLFDMGHHLRSGSWKVPFYYPPILPDMDTSELLSRPRYETAELYLRVVNQRDAGTQANMSISPSNHIDYHLPALNYPRG